MTDVAVPPGVLPDPNEGKVQVQVQFVVQALQAELATVREQHMMLTALVNQQQAEIKELTEKLETANAPATD